MQPGGVGLWQSPPVCAASRVLGFDRHPAGAVRPRLIELVLPAMPPAPLPRIGFGGVSGVEKWAGTVLAVANADVRGHSLRESPRVTSRYELAPRSATILGIGPGGLVF